MKLSLLSFISIVLISYSKTETIENQIVLWMIVQAKSITQKRLLMSF